MKSIQQSEEDSNSSGVPVPEATTDVVSLLFSSSEVLEILCSTGISTGICMIFFRHWTQSFFPIFEALVSQ